MNHTTAPQPTRSRTISLLWFPFFFGAAASALYLLAYPHPQPRDLRLGVIGAAPARLARGVDVEPVTGTAGVARNQLAGVYDSLHGTLYVSSAASGNRASYLAAVLHPARTVDVVPLAPGDTSGLGLFFYGLPMLLVGMITTIVLLQLGMWPVRKKVATTVATGAFAAAVTFAIATVRHVIPTDGWLLLYGFLLTQAIGWFTLALSRLVRQYFLPVAMTFVLILGLPSSGGTVNADMVPTGLRWLHEVLPFGQFIEAARASAYFGNRGLVRPVAILAAWAVGAALMLAWTARPTRRGRHAAPAVAAPAGPGYRRLHGTVRSTALKPVVGATVLTLDDAGNELLRTTTAADGGYAVDNVRPGLHHLVVTAAHHEPEIVTIVVHHGRAEPARDITLTDWSDPAGNLTAEEISNRGAPVA